MQRIARNRWLWALLLLSTPASARGVSAATDSSSFPARLPTSHRIWSNSDGGSSDDGGGEQSEGDSNERVNNNTNTNATVVEVEEDPSEIPYVEEPSEDDNNVQEQEPLRDHEEEGEEEEEPSQPLQTLHKLQQMLDETDYMTTRRPSPNAEVTSTSPRQKTVARTDTFSTAKPSPSKVYPDPPASAQYVATPAVSSLEKSDSAAKTTPNNKKSKDPPEKLWTSRDRSKYKKQQRLQKAVVRPVTTNASPLPGAATAAKKARIDPPIQPFSPSDEEETSEDYDDGLGYTLPNLPVYYSDTEGAESETENDADTKTTVSSKPPPSSAASPSGTRPPGIVNYQPSSSLYMPQSPPAVATANSVVPSNYAYGPYYPPPPPEAYGHQQQQQQQQPPYEQQQQQMQQQQQPPYPYPQGYPPYMYPPFPYPYPSSYYASPQQQQQHMQFLQQQQLQQQYWSLPPNAYPPPMMPRQLLPRVLPRQDQQQQQPQQQRHQSTEESSSPVSPPPVARKAPAAAAVVLPNLPAPVVLQEPQTKVSPRVNFSSMQEMSLLLVTVALACYSAVSPRTLPLAEYNAQFHENMRIVSLAAIVPAINFLTVFDKRENDINTVIRTFFTSFTAGYALTFVVEIIVTTLVRLGVFSWLEPDIFALTPQVPLPILPWVVRENKYRPKRITLLAADFCTSCVASPIVEEYMKLLILQWTVRLPRNFQWVTKTKKKTKGKKKNHYSNRKVLVADPIVRRPGEMEVVNANPYVTHMLAASVGLKLCDATRRILMYTKAQHTDKSFYAFCRGVFPIQELCGTMTAIGLAKRDLLGMDMPLWKILLPAVVVHGMANFRGMKPLYKWNSSMPWSEMQLSPLHFPAASSLPQLVRNNYPKLMWFIILSRVLGYCIKNYFMVNRQARKRTTTYAGKHAAFSAELATAEMLKKK